MSMRPQKEIKHKLAELQQGCASKLDDVLCKPPSKKEKKNRFFSIFEETPFFY